MKENIVLITGGAGGIGQAAAKAFLDDGDSVVLVDLKEEALQTAKENLGNDNITIITADVTKEEDVKNYIDETVSMEESISF